MVDASVKGHRARLRQRFVQSGLDGFHDYEVLELLLTYAIPRSDVKPIAKRLMDEFTTLAGVFDATVLELQQVHGMGEAGAGFLNVIRAVEARHLRDALPQRDVLNTPERVKDYLQVWFQGKRIESFGVVFANQQYAHLATEILFEGTVDRTAVYPRTIIKRALVLDAKAIILFHNHPGGTKRASDADIALTRRMETACEALDIRVLDHFLVVGNQVLSFKEEGWW